ncbi:MAG: hypothetical protein R6X25_12275 [Candidatus Krumholzibacteriia bacterium]
MERDPLAFRAGPYLVVLGLLLAVWLASLQGAYPSDDALIHLRYARNLAEHGELSFNPGEKSYSTTSPLWNATVGLTASLAAVSEEQLLRYSQAVAAVWLVLAVVSLLWFGRVLYGRWLPAAAILFVLDPYVTASVHGAMEQPLFIALGALGLGLVVRGERGSAAALVAAAAVFAIQYAARPESLAFVAASGLYLLIRRRPRGLVVFGVAAICSHAIALGVLHQVMGSPLPLSMLMKTHDAHGWLPFSSIGSSRQVLRLFAQVYALPLLALVVWLVLRAPAQRREFLGRNLLPLLVVGLLATAYVGFLKERTVSSRYLVSFTPLVWIVVADALGSARRRQFAAAALGGLAVYLVVLNLLAVPVRVQRGLALEPERIELGTWLNRNTPPDATVWVFDIGYIGYHADRRIYDFNLVDAPGTGTELALRKRRGELDLARAIREHRIDYLVWGPTDLPDLPLERVYTAQHEKHGGHRSIYRVLHGVAADSADPADPAPRS